MCAQGSCFVCTASRSSQATCAAQSHTAHNLHGWDFTISSQIMRCVHHPQGPVVLAKMQPLTNGSLLLPCLCMLCFRIEAEHSESAELYSVRVSKLQRAGKRTVSMSRHARHLLRTVVVLQTEHTHYIGCRID